MFKLGDTSGLCAAHCDDKKHTIKVVGDVIEKMAKKCEDVPKKMRAPSKVIEITNGCFSSAQVVEVSDENSADNGEGAAACAGAAATGGGCGGGKTPKQPVCPGSGGCGKKSCCGGKQKKNKDPCSGQKLIDLVVPKTIDDFINSDYDDLLDNEHLNETDFQQKYCSRQPYPECATCPYNSNRIKTQERDLGSIFKQMDQAIQTMMQGNYSLSDNMFACPGMMKMLMNGNVRTMAEVAVPNAIEALIDVVAARGALESFKGIAQAADLTDFRSAIMGSANKLLSAGGKVGIPRAFVTEVGKILEDIGCSPRTITRLLAASTGPRDTTYGPTYSLCGDRGGGCCRKNVPYTSSGRCCASPTNATRAEEALDKVKPAIESARQEITNPPTVSKPATSNVPTYTPTKDDKVVEGKTYYKHIPETGATIPVETKVGEPIAQVEAKNGLVFEVVDTGINKPVPKATTDTVVTTGKEYFFNDPVTKQNLPVETKVGEPIAKVVERVAEEHGIDTTKTPVTISERTDPEKPVVAAVKTKDTSVKAGQQYYDKDHKKLDLPVGTPISNSGTVTVDGVTVEVFEDDVSNENVTYEKVDETIPLSDRTYFTINDNTGLFEVLDTTSGEPFEKENVFIKVVAPIDTDEGTSVYTGTEACILDDGLIVEEPVFIDAASYVMAVDTRSLVTKTGVTAGEMASIEGIGLSPYEIKMAYILDSESNGSILPDDIDGVRIPTILDTISDDD